MVASYSQCVLQRDSYDIALAIDNNDAAHKVFDRHSDRSQHSK